MRLTINLIAIKKLGMIGSKALLGHELTHIMQTDSETALYLYVLLSGTEKNADKMIFLKYLQKA